MDDGIRDQYEADAQALHADYGEPCQYRQVTDAGNPIETTALVERDALSTSQADSQRTVRTPIVVELLRSAVPVIVEQKDEIKLAPREGGTLRWYPVTALLDHDEVHWRVSVGR